LNWGLLISVGTTMPAGPPAPIKGSPQPGISSMLLPAGTSTPRSRPQNSVHLPSSIILYRAPAKRARGLPGLASRRRAPNSGHPAGESETMMNRNQYTGSSHELLPGDVCSLEYRGQIPPLQSSQRREAKGQCGPAKGAQSVRVAETSPECQKREPVVACATGTTLPLDGEVLAGIVAWVVRAGMASNGGPDDRGKPCIVPGTRVAEGRMNKPEAKRCKGSDKSIVAPIETHRTTNPEHLRDLSCFLSLR
jgi:hypothetical protein